MWYIYQLSDITLVSFIVDLAISSDMSYGYDLSGWILSRALTNTSHGPLIWGYRITIGRLQHAFPIMSSLAFIIGGRYANNWCGYHMNWGPVVQGDAAAQKRAVPFHHCTMLNNSVIFYASAPHYICYLYLLTLGILQTKTHSELFFLYIYPHN